MKVYQLLWRLFRANKLTASVTRETLRDVSEHLDHLEYVQSQIDLAPVRDRFKELVEYKPKGARPYVLDRIFPDGEPTLPPDVAFPLAVDTTARPEPDEPVAAAGCDCVVKEGHTCGCTPPMKVCCDLGMGEGCSDCGSPARSSEPKKRKATSKQIAKRKAITKRVAAKRKKKED